MVFRKELVAQNGLIVSTCLLVAEVTYETFYKYILREKCPNTEFFLVRIFQYSDWIQENSDQKNSDLDIFHVVVTVNSSNSGDFASFARAYCIFKIGKLFQYFQLLVVYWN